jgi:ADP-heptose:LPS heptosyltransferase
MSNPPSETHAYLVDPTPLSDSERRYIDEYTLDERLHQEHPGAPISLKLRLRRAIEGINRRMWYWGFSKLIHNKPVHERIPIQKLESIFVIPIGDAIGDMVVALPLFHAIKRHHPSCRVGTLVSPRNRVLLQHDSSVDTQYLFRDKSDLLHYPHLFHARKDGYQVVINLHLPRMTEFGIISNIIGGRGIKVSSSHSRKDMYQQLFNMLLPYDRNSMHLSQLGLMMLESVIDFGNPLQQWESYPTLRIDDVERTSVKTRIHKELDRLGADWFVHFNPQARNPTREWGYDNAFAFAEHFVQHYPRGGLFFTASPVHRAEVEKRIASLHLPRVTFFPTSYNLLELAVLSSESELVITPDTSAIHFGTASGKPTLVLWPDPEFLPMEWIPLQIPSINLAPEVQGMLVPTISVESVWQAARKLLDKEWTSSATSYGLNPSADPLYQFANRVLSIESLIKISSIPKIFPEGSHHSVPLATLAGELVVH